MYLQCTPAMTGTSGRYCAFELHARVPDRSTELQRSVFQLEIGSMTRDSRIGYSYLQPDGGLAGHGVEYSLRVVRCSMVG